MGRIYCLISGVPHSYRPAAPLPRFHNAVCPTLFPRFSLCCALLLLSLMEGDRRRLLIRLFMVTPSAVILFSGPPQIHTTPHMCSAAGGRSSVQSADSSPFSLPVDSHSSHGHPPCGPWAFSWTEPQSAMLRHREPVPGSSPGYGSRTGVGTTGPPPNRDSLETHRTQPKPPQQPFTFQCKSHSAGSGPVRS